MTNLIDSNANKPTTEDLTDAAVAFIEQHKDNPFFLYVAHWDVHGPIHARKEVLAKHKKKLENFTSIVSDGKSSETPDEMYYGKGGDIPGKLQTSREKAREERIETNRNRTCRACETPVAIAS